MSRHNMNADLEKSMRLLDNKTNTSSKHRLSVSRQSFKPQMKPPYSQEADDTFMEQSFFEVGNLKRHRPQVVDPDSSLTVHHWEMQDINQTMTQSVTMIKGKEPWKTVSDRLFVEFLETIQSRGTEQLFETLSDLIQTCSDNLGEIKKMQDKSAKKSGRSQDLWWLENERNTWRLLYCLYEHRGNKQDVAERMAVDSPLTVSEKDTAARLYEEDSATYELQLMIDWLEKNAFDQQQDGDLPRPEHYSDRTVAWENTLHQLQNKHDKIPYSSSRSIVQSLDPDAPLREGKPLHDMDKEDEDRLMKQVFLEIRCGRLEDAQNLCIHCGQPWRAAILEGWRLHHDPNYRRPGNGNHEKLPSEGNPMRDIWKLCAWQMAQDSRLQPYARATSASLCGNVTALLPVCRTWHDQLWARLKAAVDVTVEQEIRQTVTRSYQEMPQDYWQNKLSLEDIFDQLTSSSDPGVREEAIKPEHLVQQLLILDDIPRLMKEMHGWLVRGTASPQFVRFLAHLVLMLRQMGRNYCEEIGDTILEAYVKILMDQGNPCLVAYYVSVLPPCDQVRWYAMYLADVKEPEDRQACLEAAESTGLDVQAITKAVVEYIRNQAVEGSLPDLKAEVSEDDLEKISALDWVVYYPGQREEALWQSNALIRHFLAVGKIEAAKMALNKVPC